MKIVDIGNLPPTGTVPEYMYAHVIRQQRYGRPSTAYVVEEVKVPELAPDEVLIAVMAAGLNYNSVWSAMGYPVDVIKLMQMRKDSTDDFQIAGSDCSGIVYKIGSKVTNVAVGDEVVVQPGYVDPEDPWLKSGGEYLFAPSARAWGYETNWGSYAQFCKVKYIQCMPKPPHLSWEQAAVYMLSGITAYRMLYKYEPHTVKPGDVVLIWGGAGGLGSMAIQLTLMNGGIPVAVVNSEERKQYCEGLGAATINRNEFAHWGELTNDTMSGAGYAAWMSAGAKEFKKSVMTLTGGKLPRIVLEHPGQQTMPTSLFVCDKDGMVVTCAGTTGYIGSFDLRHLWLQRKRIQGSHFAEYEDCIEFNKLIMDKKIMPVLERVEAFNKLPDALQCIQDNVQKGNTAIKIGLSQ